jgi:hypothetical protein
VFAQHAKQPKGISMAPSDFSYSLETHNQHTPVKTPPPPPRSSASDATATDASTAPSFSAIFANMAAEAAAAGTTVASTAPPPGGTATAATAATATGTQSAGSASTTDTSGDPFGPNPWLTDPTGSGPGPVTNYNPIYFATQQTADTVAQMSGGTVVSMEEFTSAPGSPFQQNEPNLMVQLPDGGLVNPGLVADIYTHGWNQSFINQQVANEFAGAAPANTNG